MERINPRYFAVVILSVSLAACGTGADANFQSAPSAQDQAIINGEAATQGAYPSTGALLIRDYGADGSIAGSLCTGTLIAPDTVLTAGHCVGDRPDSRRFYFYLGNDARAAMEAREPAALPLTHSAIAAVRHQRFHMTGAQGLGNASDLGLIFLEVPILDVEPAVLLHPDESHWLEAGAALDIVGYGVRQPPEYGLGSEGQLGEKYFARSVIGEVGRFELQAGAWLPIPQKCHGDSGGPSFINSPYGAHLVGVTSRAYDSHGCTRGGVDTRPDAFYTWISRTMQQACQQGVRSPCYPLS